MEACELSGINKRVGVEDLYKYLKDMNKTSFSLLRKKFFFGQHSDESGVQVLI